MVVLAAASAARNPKVGRAGLAGGESGGRARGDGWRFVAAQNPKVRRVGGVGRRFAAARNPDVGRAGAGAGAVYAEPLIVRIENIADCTPLSSCFAIFIHGKKSKMHMQPSNS
jgi:hypothetical protein